MRIMTLKQSFMNSRASLKDLSEEIIVKWVLLDNRYNKVSRTDRFAPNLFLEG